MTARWPIPKIKFLTNTVVEDIYDVTQMRCIVTGVKLRNVVTNEVIRSSRVDGLFVAIGHIPNTQAFRLAA